jgi:hypothetical protein
VAGKQNAAAGVQLRHNTQSGEVPAHHQNHMRKSMTVSRQFVTFGAMMLVAGTFLPTSQAQAFGQQWRPTVAAAPAQGKGFRRIANVPSFRPHVSSAGPHFRAPPTVRSRPVSQPMVAMRPVAPPAYPRRSYRREGQAAPSAWSSMPMWSNPFTQMAQIWPNPMPMYPSQFAGRPVERPWISQYARPQQPSRHRLVNPAPLNEYRPRNSLSAVYGAGQAPVWRQAHQAAITPRPVPTRAVRGGYASVPGRFTPPRAARVPQFAAAGMPRGYWRPDQAAMTPRFARSDPFRPATYGRTASRDRLPTQQGTVAQELPGWVTTHPDAGNLRICEWCNGS